MKKLVSVILILSIFTAAVASGYRYRNIAGAATTVVKSGRGKLVAVIVNKAIASGVITIYDNTAASGTKISTITNPGTLHQDQYQFIYNCDITAGITVVTSSTDDVTIIYE